MSSQFVRPKSSAYNIYRSIDRSIDILTRSIWHSFWHRLASILASFQAFIVAFYLASVLASFKAFMLASWCGDLEFDSRRTPQHPGFTGSKAERKRRWGQQGAEEGEEREEGEEGEEGEGVAPLFKTRDLDLASGEKTFNLIIRESMGGVLHFSPGCRICRMHEANVWRFADFVGSDPQRGQSGNSRDHLF